MGGGVGIYINNDFTAKINRNLSPFHEKILESITVETKIKNKKFSLTSLYRPPTNNQSSDDTFFECFDQLLTNMNNDDTNYIIFSDSNLNLLKLNHCKKSQKYMEIIHNNGFLQIIKKATRIQPPSFSLIDHIMIKGPFLELSTGVLTEDISDHFLTFLSIENTDLPPKQKFITKRNFSAKNIADFSDALSKINFDYITSVTDVNLAFDEFWNTFYSIFEFLSPFELLNSIKIVIKLMIL